MPSDYDHDIGILESAIDEVVELVNILRELGQLERAHTFIPEIHRLNNRLQDLLDRQ